MYHSFFIHRYQRSAVLICVSAHLVIFLMSACTSPPAQQNKHVHSEKVMYNVTGMHCDGCALAIQNAVTPLPGIITCKASFSEKNVVIEFDPDTISNEKILAKLNTTGYTFEKGDGHKPATHPDATAHTGH